MHEGSCASGIHRSPTASCIDEQSLRPAPRKKAAFSSQNPRMVRIPRQYQRRASVPPAPIVSPLLISLSLSTLPTYRIRALLPLHEY